jgi:PAS domain S-box-containing protein
MGDLHGKKKSKVINELNHMKVDPLHEHQLISAMAAYGGVVIWLLDQDLNVIFANKAFNDYLAHYSEDEEMGLLENDHLSFYSIGRFRKIIYSRVLAGENVQVTARLPGERWVKIWMSPAQLKGESKAIACWGFDVSDEMEAKFALIRSEKKFRNIFESFQDIFFRCKVEGEIMMINPSVEIITGYRPEELQGNNITHYYFYSETPKELVKRLVREKVIKNIEISLIHRSGRIIPSICTINFVNDDEGTYIEGIVKDIAEIKKVNEDLEHAIELAERSLKIKERFLANMSHEIRTPLNGIIGMVNVLEQTALNNEQSEQVHAIKESSDVLLKLLNNLLDRSKLEAGKMVVDLAPVAPRQILQKVLLIYRQRAIENEINLIYNLDEKLPEYILADEVKIMQVLSNLISNAIKFTGKGGHVAVNFRLNAALEHYIKIKCEVRDTGIGIKEEEKKKVFQSFTQLDDSENKKHEGVGLGLSISKQLLTLLGGEIGVESTPGKGSTFWFTFKSQVSEKKQGHISKILRVEKLDYRLKILVVDDNRINQEVATQILRKAGAEVVKAASGEEAIKILQHEVFDIILLDIQMPGISGIDVIKWMQSTLKDYPPVIALTAYNSGQEKEKFISLGFNDFIGKPINPEVLLDKIKDWTAVQEKVIDHNVLKKLAQYGGEAMVQEAMKDFYEDTEKQIKECFVSLSGQNHKRVLEILHTIKGNAGTLGIKKLARSAKQIEEHLKKGYIARLEEELQGLEHFFQEFKAQYFEQF